MQTVFNVLDYGADPTGTTSSQAAFQNAINAAKAITVGPGYGFTNVRAGTVYVPRGGYTGITTLDCTNCVGLVIQGDGSWGSAIYADAQTTSYPVIDCTQSNYVTIENLSIQAISSATGGQPAVMPQCAILISDSSAYPNSSNKIYLNKVNVYGWWRNCALGVLNSSDNNYIACIFSNYHTSAPVVFVGNNNITNLQSAFIPVSTTHQAANENVFFGCEIHSSNVADPVCNTLWLAGVETFQMFGGIVDGNGSTQPSVYMLGSCNKIFFSGVKFYCQTAWPCPCLFYNNGTVNDLVCIGSWSDYAAITIQSGPGIWGTVQLNGI
jgi:hypothetical protein